MGFDSELLNAVCYRWAAVPISRLCVNKAEDMSNGQKQREDNAPVWFWGATVRNVKDLSWRKQ